MQNLLHSIIRKSHFYDFFEVLERIQSELVSICYIRVFVN